MLRCQLAVLLMSLLSLSSCTSKEEKPAPKEPVQEAAPIPDGSDVEDVSLDDRDEVPVAEPIVTRDEVLLGDEPESEEPIKAPGQNKPVESVKAPSPVKPVEPSKPTQNAQPSKAEAGPATPGVYYVKSAVALVRDQPNDAAKTLRTLNRGDRLAITAVQGDWGTVQGGGFTNIKELSKSVIGPSRKTNEWKSKKK